MDHLPFEDWILNEEQLTTAQKRDLALHLQGCRSCTALGEVNLALRSPRQAEPAPGFSTRFQARLVEHKRSLRQRNALGFSLLAFSVVGIFTGAAWPVLRSAVESPLEVVSSWLSSLVGLWVSIQALFQAGFVLFRVAPGFVPGYIWTVLIFILSGWSMVWIYSLLKYTRVQQGV